MKERPILFSSPMVRAILDGRKTMTRRIVKPPLSDAQWIEETPENGWLVVADGEPTCGTGVWDMRERAVQSPIQCPYGVQGDRLWVREAWRTTGDGGRCDDMAPRELQPYQVWYEADGSAPADECVGKYRPSMFMPRWASRITLEVTGVRVERLRDISYEDALAEGIPNFADTLNNEPSAIGETPEETARRLRWPQRWFECLWTDINGAESWDANPWVWVVSFRRIS